MNIAVISFRPLERPVMREEERLLEAAAKLGHKADILRFDQFQLGYDGEGTEILYDGKPLTEYDIIIPRVSLLQNVEGTIALVKQLEINGWPVINRYEAVCKAKDKLKTLQILQAAGLAVLRSMIIRSPEYVETAIKFLGEAPYIIKILSGSLGSGTVIVESKRSLKSVWQAMAEVNPCQLEDQRVLLIQEYIAESSGQDLRVFVVGDKVVGAMRRMAEGDEFRSNLELGGKSQAVEVDEKLTALAIKATLVLGLDIAGVDIIMSKRGALVLEVNANAGFKGLEKATGKDVAGEIIKYAVTFAGRSKD